MSEDGSPIGKRLKRTGKMLLDGAENQVNDYRRRFDSLSGAFDDLLCDFMKPYPQEKLDTDFVDEFFGNNRLTFRGIDGTVCKHSVFDLLIFFAGAYSSGGCIDVESDGAFEIVYDENHLESGIGISSVLPVYISEVPDIDKKVAPRDEEGDVDPAISYSDAWIIDNSAVADYMMGFAEFYLGYKVVSTENPVDILFLDRILSSEVSSFYAETSPSRVRLNKESAIIGNSFDGEVYTPADWIYARKLFGNPELGTPPPRGEYVLPRVMNELIQDNGLTENQLAKRLNIDSAARRKRLQNELKKGTKAWAGAKPVLELSGKKFSVRSGVLSLHERTESMLKEIGEKIFSERIDVSVQDRFKINSHWLTTVDFSFLSLMSIYFTIRNCHKNNILLLGIAKDTSARDLKRQVIPTLNHTKIYEGGFGQAASQIPDTDRMILQWTSLKARDEISVPWATIEYDTAFKTIIPHFDGKQGLVSGARRNQISLEKTFAKSYFQLSEAKSDPKLRSNVLLYDRLVYPSFDTDENQVTRLQHDYTGNPAEPEPIDLILYLETQNRVQQFIVTLIRAMTSSSIPELFGHLKPLYIADKVAKYYYQQFDSIVQSTANWLVNRPSLREFLFYLSSFRERRTEYEETRRIS
ncbi:hypothetical protein EU537_10485 [Candidatus Thorarchaeota archaeon]|nr:MAG: hypothetical protein EU537_10485 [Candidatus Thorarchaeota archaeon]